MVKLFVGFCIAVVLGFILLRLGFIVQSVKGYVTFSSLGTGFVLVCGLVAGWLVAHVK